MLESFTGFQKFFLHWVEAKLDRPHFLRFNLVEKQCGELFPSSFFREIAASDQTGIANRNILSLREFFFHH